MAFLVMSSMTYLSIVIILFHQIHYCYVRSYLKTGQYSILAQTEYLCREDSEGLKSAATSRNLGNRGYGRIRRYARRTRSRVERFSDVACNYRQM